MGLDGLDDKEAALQAKAAKWEDEAREYKAELQADAEAFGKAVLDEAAEEEANLKERVAEGQCPPHGRRKEGERANGG